jgi:hypothetical protein
VLAFLTIVSLVVIGALMTLPTPLDDIDEEKEIESDGE